MASTPQPEPPSSATPAEAPRVASRNRWLLALAAFLFLAWTGFMLVLALTTAEPIVISRPQFYIAPVVVQADVPEGTGSERTVQVREVFAGKDFLPPAAADAPAEGIRLVVTDIGTARGWRGPGEYILALERVVDSTGKTHYELVPTPPSPGFPPLRHPERRLPAIYPATPAVQQQVREALAARDRLLP